MRLAIRFAAFAAAALAMLPAVQAQTVEWQLINEYPANSLTGEADAFFAEAVKRATGGRLVVVPVPDAKSGLRTREHLKAVTDGRFAMASSFGGALADDSPLFLLSSLPFVTPSDKDARALRRGEAALRQAVRRAWAEAPVRLALAALGHLVVDRHRQPGCAQGA